MADFETYWNKVVMRWSGGATFTDNPKDPGGATKYDVTLRTLQGFRHDTSLTATDVQNLTEGDAILICKSLFWDKWRADSITNQSIAEQVVDWEWGSGYFGLVGPQKVLETEMSIVVPDGVPGVNTINAINNWPDGQYDLFCKLRSAHIAFIGTIIANHPAEEVFKNGWINRINAVTFIA